MNCYLETTKAGLAWFGFKIFVIIKMSSDWNVSMTPPVVDTYTEEEVNAELIHSFKAFYTCYTPAEVFAVCRKGIDGSIINPEKCLDHARAVFECYQETKIVPSKCQESFNLTLQCLNQGKMCENFVQDYAKCEHPAAAKYAGYH